MTGPGPGVLDIPANPPGLLRPPPAEAWELTRAGVTPALEPWVQWHWQVVWDLREHGPHTQATVGHPSAHLVVEDGGAWLWGPRRRRWERTLRGTGRALGTRLRPGAVRVLLGAPAGSIVDRRVDAGSVTGLDAAALVAAVEATDDAAGGARAVEAALGPLLPGEPDPAMRLADDAVRILAEDRTLARADALAARLGLSVRSLHRLFAEHVGLGPGQVIRRFRLQAAAARALSGEWVDWSALAFELGYAD